MSNDILHIQALVMLVIFLYLMGIITYGGSRPSGEEMTPQTARRAVIWPILVTIAAAKLVLYFSNEILAFIFLLVGYEYRDTNIYKSIDNIKI